MASLETLAIIQTSRDRPEVAARFQPDGIKFQRLLRPALPHTQLDIYDAVDRQYPADLSGYSAYLLTGSPSSITQSEPWIAHLLDVIVQLHAQRIPTIGICFGHQAVAQALGGRVERSAKGWGLGIKPVRFAPEPWMQPPAAELNLIHIHQDQVVRLPPGARLLAGDEFCPCSSFAIGDRILTVQAHPEFDRAFMEGIIEIYRDDFPENIRNQALASTGKTNHGSVFASWIAHFLTQSGS